MHFEWRLSLGTVIWSIAAPVGSFALPAWTSKAANIFAEYAPFSWVAAGFIGLFTYSLCYFLVSVGHGRFIRSRYDSRHLGKSANVVNPMDQVFEKKRIFLNDFCLPSQPFIHEKTFIDCEIVGPANITLWDGNRVDEARLPKSDAVALTFDARPNNAYALTQCTFRRCSFQRVTFFIADKELPHVRSINWLNWISPMPAQADLPGSAQPSQIEDQSGQS
jgi:hypothetical protein